jgi:hypothetical protein
MKSPGNPLISDLVKRPPRATFSDGKVSLAVVSTIT